MTNTGISNLLAALAAPPSSYTSDLLPIGVPSRRAFAEHCRTKPDLAAVKVGKCWIVSRAQWEAVCGAPATPVSGIDLDAAVRARSVCGGE